LHLWRKYMGPGLVFASSLLAADAFGASTWMWPTLVAVLWLTTVVAMVVVILSIAKWSLNKASASDVPKVLAGLGVILAALTAWLPRRIVEEARNRAPSLTGQLTTAATAADRPVDGPPGQNPSDRSLPSVLDGAIVESAGGEP
jgi:hypothetical protein